MQNTFFILLALLAANLPFFNQRLFACLPANVLRARLNAKGKKKFWVRLIELYVLYAVLGALAYFMEASKGNVFSQGWQFYAITIFLFLVLAFPGFVFQHLMKRP